MGKKAGYHFALMAKPVKITLLVIWMKCLFLVCARQKIHTTKISKLIKFYCSSSCSKMDMTSDKEFCGNRVAEV